VVACAALTTFIVARTLKCPSSPIGIQGTILRTLAEADTSGGMKYS
jgi:hypothetical protein